MASTSTISTCQATTSFTAPEEASTSSICEVEERIEHSKRHWSLLADSDCSFTEEEEAADNVEVFRTLQSHPTWGDFFKTFGYDLGVPGRGSAGTLEVGEKFAEGGQAELFHAQVTWRNPEYNEYCRERGLEWVVKVFKKGTLLRHLQKQWPHGYLQYWAELLEQARLGKRDTGPRFHCEVMYGMLLEDGRFAFLMTKEEGDLRRLIERKMLERGHGYEGPPFPKETAEEIMYRVAEGMNWLHSLGIVHRDLKASNVLMKELVTEYLWCGVGDFECSVGVVGTGFFRAPEVLQACKDGVTSKPGLFTKAVDVYSYGMTCYEILTGKLPFQHHPLSGNIPLLTDHVINGLRPEVPNFVDDWAVELLQRCWHTEPLARPTIGEILLLLEANSNSRAGRALPCPSHLVAKEEGDLRSLSERKMLERGHGYEGPPFPKETAEEIMYRVALGVNWLHSLGIVHRDLKASNENNAMEEKQSSNLPNFSQNSTPSGDYDVSMLKFLYKFLYKEIMKIGYISEASLKDLDGEETIVLCNYNAQDDSLEFYFKHSKDMASVVGVGLDYAKVLLIEGWIVIVKEIFKEDWMQAWKIVESNSTTTFKLLSVESDALNRAQEEVFTGKELKPFLWALAKYFILDESIDSLVKSTTTSTSGASTSGGQGTGSNDNGKLQDLIKLFIDELQSRKNDDEDNDDEGNKKKGKGNSPDPSPSDVDDNDYKWSKVFLDLLPGGEILPREDLEEVKFVKEKLEALDKRNRPHMRAHLEFTFKKKEGEKKIEVMVGNIEFNLGLRGGSEQVQWIHNNMSVSFGLQGSNQVFGELVRGSCKHLDVTTGKDSMKSSRTNEKRKGIDLSGGIRIGMHTGGNVDLGIKRSNADADIQQDERGFERDCDLLTGGLKFRSRQDPDEHEIRFEYFFDGERYGNELFKSPMSFERHVRFQGTWRPLDVKQNGVSEDFVAYTLEASRNLEEIAGEVDVKTKKTDTGEGSSPHREGSFKYLKKPIKYVKEKVTGKKPWKAATGGIDSTQHGPLKCKQRYTITLLVSHAMKNLVSETHELREEEGRRDSYTYRYFVPVEKRIFEPNGRPKEYVWPENGKLLKLEEPEPPRASNEVQININSQGSSSVATTSDINEERVATASDTNEEWTATAIDTNEEWSATANDTNEEWSATASDINEEWSATARDINEEWSATASDTNEEPATCDFCEAKPPNEILRCRRCNSMNYCNESCRALHWTFHRRNGCRPVNTNAS